jgi:hypothetical protein
MPNWCQNEIIFTHESKEMLDKLEEAVKEEKVLEFLRPMPNEMENDGGWCNWCISNWGTKWDLCHIEWVQRQDDNRIVIRAESAWSPPIQAFEYAEKNGWKITAIFFEAGSCFAGVFRDGVADMRDVDDVWRFIITSNFSPYF